MHDSRMESITFELITLRHMHSCCPLLDYEINKTNALARMIMRHGGDFSHPMLREKNRKIDEMTMFVWKSMCRF